MGAKLFKQTFLPQIGEGKTENVLADNAEFVSYKKLDEEFDKLYLDSRALLLGITRNPSDELLTNISRCMKTNSKLLSNCFNEAASHRSDILDLIADRLTYHGTDINVRDTESKFIDSCLPMTMKRRY